MFSGSLAGLGLLGCGALGCPGSQRRAQGARCPLCPVLPSPVPLPLPSYSPSSIWGLALTAAVDDLGMKDTIELASSDPGYYSRLFVTPKVTVGFRPVIHLSRLNCFISCLIFVWRHLCWFSSLCIWGTGWCPSTFTVPTFRFLSIRNLVGTFGFVLAIRSSYFGFCVLTFRWLCKSSHVSWPRSPPSCIASISDPPLLG